MRGNQLGSTEHDHQVAVMQFADQMKIVHPELSLIFGTMNGVRVRIGTAAKMKAAGNKKGVPDVILPFPKNPFHGLFIELKRPKIRGVSAGVVKVEQMQWLEALSAAGYATYICYGSHAACDTLLQYCRGEAEKGVITVGR